MTPRYRDTLCQVVVAAVHGIPSYIRFYVTCAWYIVFEILGGDRVGRSSTDLVSRLGRFFQRPHGDRVEQVHRITLDAETVVLIDVSLLSDFCFILYGVDDEIDTY